MTPESEGEQLETEKMPFLKNSVHWFVWDPCGIVCAVMTYILMVYGEFVVLAVLAPPFLSVGTFISVAIFTTFAFLAVVAHVKAMITDPGVVPRESSSEEEVLERRQQGEEIRYCKKCRSIKPDRAHHCSTCEHCIQRMDHHCPWVNNCVGENNQKFFVLFTLYVMLMAVYGLGMVAWFFYQCASADFKGCDTVMPGPLVFIVTLFGVFEGFLFSLFTCIMFCTQIYAIATDETGIESLKKEKRSRSGWMDGFVEIFGSDPGVAWLNPFSAAPYPPLLRRRTTLSV